MTPSRQGWSTLVAILRGLDGTDAVVVGRCLYDAGLRTLEVPLNSPDPLGSIAALRDALPEDCLVGAGTVLTAQQVRDCHAAGAGLVVSPNTDPDVIAQTTALGMRALPGAATPSEAFRALDAGATTVKVFPAVQVGPEGLGAWRSVLPPGTALVPVGGLDADAVGTWFDAGADGVGIGSTLYRPGISLTDLRRRALALLEAVQSATSRRTPA